MRTGPITEVLLNFSFRMRSGYPGPQIARTRFFRATLPGCGMLEEAGATTTSQWPSTPVALQSTP